MTEPWKYETAQNLDQPMIERLRHFPRDPDMLVYGIRSLAALIIRGWLRFYHRFKIVGHENLPLEGSFIMVGNHSSHLDAVCLLSCLPLSRLHRAFPAAAADYFFESVPRTWLAAGIVNALPFGREVHIRQSLVLCERLLENPGNVLVIFPEGTRSKTGEIGRFKPGVGTLLAGRDIPVVPCFLDGAFKAWPKDKFIPRPTRITLHIGVPRKYTNLPTGKESSISIAEDLLTRVNELKHSHEND